MFRASWKLSLLIWPLLVTSASRAARAGAKKVGKSAERLALARDEALGFAEERLQHRDIVRWFLRTEDEAEEYRKHCDTCLSVVRSAARHRGVAHLVTDFAAKCVFLGLCRFGSWLVERGEMTSGELTEFFFHASFLGLGLYGLVGLAPEITIARAAAQRLSGVVACGEVSAAARGCGKGSLAAPHLPLPVRFENLHYGYESSGRQVLRGFSLSIPAGSTCALVGPSGCGKSTVLAVLVGDYVPQKGFVAIGGQDIQTMSLDALREKLAVVPQGVALLGSSVHDSVAFGLGRAAAKATASEIEEAVKTVRAHDFVAVRPGGYKAPVGRGGSLLSGGERQRLALARAMVRRAPILVLDEPTSALDSTTAAELTEALFVSRPNRPTILVATHSLPMIKRCDKVAILTKDGEIVQCGTFAKLAAEPCGQLAEIIRAGLLVDDAPI